MPGSSQYTSVSYDPQLPPIVPPIAAFNAVPVSGGTPLTVQFFDASLNSPTSWLWTVGDGTPTLHGQNPSHTYTVAGTYSVTLIASNSAGSNMHTATNLIAVNITVPKPISWYDFSEVSNGSAPVTRFDSSDWRLSAQDLGSNNINCPSTTGPDGLTCVQVPGLGSLLHEQAIPAGYSLVSFDVGRGAMTVVVVSTKGSGNTGDFFGRYGGSNTAAYVVSWSTSPSNFVQLVYQSTAGVLTTLTVNNVMSAGAWLLVAVTFDPVANSVTLRTVSPSGAINSASGPYPAYFWRPSQTLVIGARSQGSNSTQGPLQSFGVFKATLTNAQLTYLANIQGGNVLGKKYASLTFSQPFTPPAAPYSNLTNVGLIADVAVGSGSFAAGWAGLTFFRPFPLYSWSPSLSATYGRYIWTAGSDHAGTGSQGIRIGFSNSPLTPPTAWTLAVPAGQLTIPANANNPSMVSEGVWTPYLTYNAGDANGRPFYLYFMAENSNANNLPFEQTALRTSADLVTWVDEGFAIPFSTLAQWNSGQQDDGFHFNLTAFARITAPGELPGQTDWQAYSLGNSNYFQGILTPSTDPKNFQPTTNAITQDKFTVVPEELGANGIDLFGVPFVAADGNVYSVTRTSFLTPPASPGVPWRLVTLIRWQQNAVTGRWDQVALGCFWPLIYSTANFPALGYWQDVSTYYESGTLYMYITSGFWQSNGHLQQVFLYTINM
jgi:PKD repeat protein